MATVGKGIEPHDFCWRLNIKTAAEEGVNPHDFCIKKGILGVGWRVETDQKSLDWESYLKLGNEQYYYDDNGWWPAVRALYERMHVDELCWTRNPDGLYYLGRITSDWRYQNTQKNRQADVVNVRKCEWHLVGKVDSVPGKVVNSFIPSRTVQRVNDKSASVYSHYLFNKLRKKSLYKLDQRHNDFDLFTLISAEDCEDIVGIYLQSQGYRFIPSSCKSHTAGYEFVLKREGSGESAVVQVKQGGNRLDASEYGKVFKEDKVFLFHTQGNYIGNRKSNVKCLDPEEMKRFALSNRVVLSDRLNNWIDIWQAMTK